MKPTEAGTDRYFRKRAGRRRRDHRERDVGQHQQCLDDRTEGREEQKKISASATGTTTISRAAARCGSRLAAQAMR
jgi:hypothetical protein